MFLTHTHPQSDSNKTLEITRRMYYVNQKNNNIDVRLHDKYANRKTEIQNCTVTYYVKQKTNKKKTKKKYDILSQIVIYVKLPGHETKNHTLTMRMTTESKSTPISMDWQGKVRESKINIKKTTKSREKHSK